MIIESTQNPKIKNLLKLQEKSRERKKQGIFVVEGIQENQLALDSGFEAEEFFICEPIFNSEIQLPSKKIISITPALFEKVAYRGTTGGIIGIYKTKKVDFDSVQLSKTPLIVILESVEKPGNLGAVLRTCDGGGVDLLVVCDPLIDFYNPNVIRSSVGTVFTNQVVSSDKEKVMNWLRKENVQIVSTFLRDDTKSLYEVDFTHRTAIVLGTEAFGLTEFWAEHSDVLVKIPMNGKVDSLNVSNAAAICIYEAVRQKG